MVKYSVILSSIWALQAEVKDDHNTEFNNDVYRLIKYSNICACPLTPKNENN